jgi:hypothetical protein
MFYFFHHNIHIHMNTIHKLTAKILRYSPANLNTTILPIDTGIEADDELSKELVAEYKNRKPRKKTYRRHRTADNRSLFTEQRSL